MIGSALVRNPEGLPDRPGIAVPYKLQKAVTLQQLAILFAVQYTLNVFWQRIKHPQPGKVAILQDFNDLLRQDNKEAIGTLHLFHLLSSFYRNSTGTLFVSHTPLTD